MLWSRYIKILLIKIYSPLFTHVCQYPILYHTPLGCIERANVVGSHNTIFAHGLHGQSRWVRKRTYNTIPWLYFEVNSKDTINFFCVSLTGFAWIIWSFEMSLLKFWRSYSLWYTVVLSSIGHIEPSRSWSIWLWCRQLLVNMYCQRHDSSSVLGWSVL